MMHTLIQGSGKPGPGPGPSCAARTGGLGPLGRRAWRHPRLGPGAGLRLAVWLCLACWAALPTAGAAATLVLGVVRSPLSLPVYVADAQGYFAREGVDVRLQDCAGGQRCLQQMLDGTVQLATASELPVVFNSFKRADFAIVATFSKGNQNIALVGRKSAGATDAAALVGKRVGYSPGTSAHYFLDAYLLLQGIDPRQLKLVALPPEGMAAAIERRDIDAFVGYSLSTWVALKALGADGLVLSPSHIYAESFNLVAGRRTLAGQRADVVKVLRALQRAQLFIAAEPQQAKIILQDRARLPQGFADAVVPGFGYRLGLEQSLVGTMEGQARWALREGHVAPDQKVPNYLQYVEFGPLREAVPSAFGR